MGQDPDVPPNIPEKGENKLDFKDNLPGNTTDLERIRPIDLEHEMKKSFISYAMAVSTYSSVLSLLANVEVSL